jgi:hypothetical protein
MQDKTRIHPLWLLVVAIVLFALMKQCEGEPKVVTKTVTKIETIHDTINETIIKEVPKTVFIEKTKTIKGKDSIIYKDKPSETTVEAKEYKTELRSNNATANLIITSKELYKVEGVITYPKETIKETTTITRDASGFYIYGSMPISSQLTTPELGVMFQIKNKLIIGVGGQYNNLNNNLSAVATIAVKL